MAGGDDRGDDRGDLRLCADLAPVGGHVRTQPEDFQVDELPLFDLTGEGEHLWLWVEKRGRTTLGAARRIARELGVKPRDVGHAGLKDARAVTRQWFSVTDPKGGAEQRLDRLERTGRLEVLEARRHATKLRIGLLAGNRFRLVVRGCDVPAAEAAARCTAVLDVLAERGIPNRFGAQRFGARGDTADLGESLVRGRPEEFLDRWLGGDLPSDRPEATEARARWRAGDAAGAADLWPGRGAPECRALRALADGATAADAARCAPRPLRRLAVAALQSRLFNRVLAARMPDLDRLLVGDLAWLHRNGAVFAVEDAAAEQPRATALEISPSGPLYGPRMTEPTGEPGDLEARILADADLQPRDFADAAGSSGLRGARRPLRVPFVEPPGAEPLGDADVILEFALPPGAYATVVLDECGVRGDAPRQA